MVRITLVGTMALSLTAWAVVAQDGAISCEEAYKAVLEKLKRQHGPERLAVHARKALRVYNACVTGDVNDAKALFDRLERLRD